MNLKKISVLKDCKFVGISNALEIQWSNRFLDENDDLFKKENHRGTIDLEGAKVEGSSAWETLNKFVPELVLEQAKEIGELNERINAMSKECAHKVEIAQKEASDKMILHTELLNAKDALKAHEDNLTMAKEINDEIYAENKVLKAEKEKLKAEKEALLKDMVRLDENIVTLNAQIVALKKGK